MISWIILVGLLIIGLGILLIGILKNGNGAIAITGLIVSILMLIINLITIPAMYYHYRIYAPERYVQLKVLVQDYKNIISENDVALNLKDFEMGKVLTEPIKYLRSFEREIRVAKRSPFTLFKPLFEIDK